MEILLALFSVLGLLFVATAFRGYVLSTIWGWFVVPTFGAPELTVATACGLALIVSLLTAGPARRDHKDEWERFKRAAASALLFPLFVLLVGRVILAFA